MNFAAFCILAVVWCVGATYAAGEWTAARYGDEIRPLVQLGGIGGSALVLSGLPVAFMLVRVGNRKGNDPAFWVWWGGGMLGRMVLLGVLAIVLQKRCGRGQYIPASMTMMAVYLVGMFLEVAWVARVLIGNERGSETKKA